MSRITIYQVKRYASVFLTLITLVSDAGINDIARDPGKVTDFLKERFCLDQPDEPAVNRLASRMTESVKAFVPDIMERIHTVVQVSVCKFICSFYTSRQISL
ncbi:unnamed protein product [Protopolystoma xenopodis]|uniref:Uncharacterized protein n=1 Tax=Protopolystoma xenopodis TaxID=117903 RepID=A0A3S5CRY0_9PLAT|nr:unnamed protein product [Protopolystoma xenopodis]